MKKHRKLVTAIKTGQVFSLIVLTVAVLTGLIVASINKRQVVDNKNEIVSQLRLGDTSKYFNEELFIKGENDKEEWRFDTSIKGAVVPHHALAGSYLSSFFDALQKIDLTTVILIGPDHKALGNNIVYTSDLTFNTEFGPVNPDMDFIHNLSKEDEIKIENELVEDEHSVITLYPYLAKYFNSVKVVPLVVNETNLESIEDLAEIIAKYINSGVMVIAAVDFSHNLLTDEAAKKDKVTISAIQERDYESLLSFDNEYLDSPTSIILLAKIMEKVNAGKFDLLANTNSYHLTGKNEQVTSYVIGVFR